MKKMLIFFSIIFMPIFALASPMGMELDIEVQLLPTAQFNLSDWNDPAINLWLVTVHNKTNHDTTVYIEFRLDVKGVASISADQNPVVWGVSKAIELAPHQVQILYSADFGDGEMDAFSISDEFQSIIERNGYLPAGSYDIKMVAWTGDLSKTTNIDESDRLVIDDENASLLDISWDHNYVDDVYNEDWNWNNTAATADGSILDNNLISTITIQEPVIDADVIDPYPWFRWDSPGFRDGVIIDYRIKIAQFNPELHSSYNDALEDANLTYFDSDWSDDYNSIYQIRENGTVQSISIQFPSGDRDLACGYQYVWQVEARENFSDDIKRTFEMPDFDGVWGWPEAVKSSIFVFNYGSRLTQDNVNSPSNGSVIPTVLPNFSWEQISCAEDYELWISDAAENPGVENPFYQSDPIQSLPFQYPMDAPGLFPGKRYNWKARYNPNSEPSPWSDILSFTVEDLNLTEPALGEELTTVQPMFNAEIPSDISSFELRISDLEDENVEIANVFNEIIPSLPFQYPQDASLGLFPGQRYYWKLIILDGNETMVGLPDDYTKIGNFTISPLTLLTPDQNETETTLNPIFSWEGPNGIPRFEFQLGDIEDTEVENPLYIATVTGNFFQYPVDADFPLEYGNSYHWKVIPLDENDNQGLPTQIRRFSTMGKPMEPAPDVQISGLFEECPCEGQAEISVLFSPVANAEYYRVLISESSEIDENNLLSDPILDYEDITLTNVAINPDDITFEFGVAYYVQVTAYKESEIHSYPSEILPLQYCRERGTDDQAELSVEFSLSEPKLLLLNLDTPVECSDEYIVTLSSEATMDNILLESEAIVSFPYTWNETVDNLEYSQQYFIKVQAYKEGEVHGIDALVKTITIPDEPGSVEQPVATISVNADLPTCAVLNFNRVQNAQSIRLFISENAEIGDGGLLATPFFTQGEIIQTNINLCDLGTELDYESNYFLQIQSEKDGELFGLPSEVYSFRTLAMPGSSDQFQFLLSSSPVNRCGYMIELLNGVTGSEEYVIEFSDEPDMSNIVNSINVNTFPVEFIIEGDILAYDFTYYVQGYGITGNAPHGLVSDIQTFQTCEQPGASAQPEFALSLGATDSRNILISLLSNVENATDYAIQLADASDMANVLFEEVISVGTFPYSIQSEFIDYSTTYFIRIQGLIDGSSHGLASIVQSVTIPAKPGSDEQVGVTVTLNPGAILPQLEVINTITGASYYRIDVSLESDMSNIIASFELSNTLALTYPSTESPLQFGTFYYIQATAFDENGEHGLASSVFTLFIPDIKSPVLTDPLYSWEGTTPASAYYLLEISTTEDFSSIISTQTTQSLNIPFTMDDLNWNSGYYWRVQGMDPNDNPFGSASNPGFFQTEAVLAAELISPTGGSETDILPDFSWSSVEPASEYTIQIASDPEFQDVVWSNSLTSTSTKYPESATILEYSGTYYWKVEAFDDAGTLLSTSLVENFTTTSIFSVSGLTPNGSAAENLTPALSWDPNENMSSYQITISLNQDMSEALLSTNVSGTPFTVPENTLENDNVYYWTVDGLNSSEQSLSGISEVASFNTPTSEILTLISPVNTEVTTLSPTLEWSVLDGASNYEVRLATDAELSNTLITENTENNSFPLENKVALENATTYYWQILAFDTDGNPVGNESDIVSFTTPEPVVITIKELADGASVSTVSPLFSWEAVEGVASYNLAFSSNSDMSESWDFSSASENFTYNSEDQPLQSGITYYWQIRAINNAGEAISSWSTARSFSISSTYIVNLESPASGNVESTKRPQFKWEGIDAADHYEIVVSKNEDFSEIVWQSQNVTELFIQYPSLGADALEYDQAYFWKVKAYNENVALGDFSSSFSFTISGNFTPMLSSPLNTEVESLTPLFSWQNIDGVHHFSLSIGADNDMSQIYHYVESITESQYQYPTTGAPPLPWSSTLYWSVSAYDEEGNQLGDASSVASFTTPSGEIEIELIFAGN